MLVIFIALIISIKHLSLSISLKTLIPRQFFKFRIQKIVSDALFWGQQGEIHLFVLCFRLAHTNNLQSVLNILGTEHTFVPFTALYIKSRTDTYRSYPR